MYYFSTNPEPERRTAWRSASEVKAAAIEHERRRFQIGKEIYSAKPQRTASGGQWSRWIAVFMVLLLLLPVLIK